MLGQRIKFRFGHGKYNDIEIKQYDPPKELGSEKKGIGAHVFGITGAVILAAGPGQTVQSDPNANAPQQTSETVSQQTSSSSVVPTGSYLPSLNHCVSAFYGPVPGMSQMFQYRNSCGVAVHVSFCRNGGGGGGAMDLAIGASGGTGDTPEAMTKWGHYMVYACPSNAILVDLKDQYAVVGTKEFRCKVFGFLK